MRESLNYGSIVRCIATMLVFCILYMCYMLFVGLLVATMKSDGKLILNHKIDRELIDEKV